MKKTSISYLSEHLNFILAMSAILISAASFYATYLQAESAKQQVKAMTYPYVQFWHGNYDEEARENFLTFSIKNAGVGPAIVKQVVFEYEQKRHQSVTDFLQACCLTELKQQVETFKGHSPELSGGELTTRLIHNRVMPMMEQVDFMSLRLHELNKPLWDKINEARWKAKVSVCYCSILEECYTSQNNGEVLEVERCEL